MATLLTPDATAQSATAELPVGVPGVEAAACPSCGARLAGEYCHACGERLRTPEQLSLRHSLREFAEDLFDVDSRAIRSLRLLLFSPGFLTLEYIRGRRRPYLGPLRMYLTVFAVTLFVTMLVPQTTPRQANGVGAMVKRLVHAVAVRRGMTDAETEKALQQVTAQHVTWLSLLIPVIFAAFSTPPSTGAGAGSASTWCSPPTSAPSTSWWRSSSSPFSSPSCASARRWPPLRRDWRYSRCSRG